MQKIFFSLFLFCISVSSFALKKPGDTKKTEEEKLFISATDGAIPEEFAIEARKKPLSIAEMAENKEELSLLQKEALARQYVLLIDKSGSMNMPDSGNKGYTRWDSTRQAVERLTKVIWKYDIDHSVPLYFFSDKVEFVGELDKPHDAIDVFNRYSPDGGTDLAAALKMATDQYLGAKRENYATVPGTTIIVLTDGQPNDANAVKRFLHEILDPEAKLIANHEELAISFVQVDDDPKAEAFLKDLDDNF